MIHIDDESDGKHTFRSTTHKIISQANETEAINCALRQIHI